MLGCGPNVPHYQRVGVTCYTQLSTNYLTYFPMFLSSACYTLVLGIDPEISVWGREGRRSLSPAAAAPSSPKLGCNATGFLETAEVRSIVITLERYAPMHAYTMSLADGDAGTAQTIREMRRLIEQGKKDPDIHTLAAKILRDACVLAEYAPAGEMLAVKAVYDSVMRNIRYTPDVTGKETLHGAIDIVRLRIGDCDDFTILICSLLETIGKTTRIVTISSHSDDPKQFSHVFPEVYVSDRGWIPLDVARKAAAFAKGPEHYYRRREWSTRSDEYRDVAGLNGYMDRHTRFGYSPAMLPGAYRANVNPVLRGALRARAPVGQGNYGTAAVRRLQLGQDSGLSPADIQMISSADPYALAPSAPSPSAYDVTSLAPLITASTTGAANIITAARASPFNLVPTTSLSRTAIAPTYPYGMIPGSPGYSALSTALFNPSTLLLLGGVLVVVMAAKKD